MNKSLSIIFFIYLFSLSSSTLFGQKLFLEGYIIDNTHDTLQGYIQESNQNHSAIYFKRTLNDLNTLKLIPSQINGFFIKRDNDFFFSKTVDINIKPDDYKNLEYNPDPIFRKDTLFLQLLEKGTINLFKLSNWDNKIHFFIEKSSEPIKELLLINYLTSDGQVNIKEIYKNQICILFIDRPSVSCRGVILSENILQKYIRSYNISGEEKKGYSKTKDKILIKTNLIAGISYKSLSYSGYDSYSYGTKIPDLVQEVNFSSSISPIFGIGFELSSPKPSNQISLGLDILLKNSTHEGHTAIYNKDVSASISLTAIQPGFLIKYNFKSSLLKPFFFMGLASNIYIHEKSRLTIKSVDFNSPLYDDAIEITPKSVDISYIGGIGTRYSRFVNELRYEYSAKGSYGATTNMQSLSLLVRYLF